MISDQQRRREFLDVLVALRQIIRATDLHSKHVMKVCGLTVPQLVVLLAIEELGAVTVKEISRHVSLSQATVTTILNRLEGRGFIERARNADDKRVVNSRLTDKGLAVLSDTPPLMDGEFMQRYERLRSERTQPYPRITAARGPPDGYRRSRPQTADRIGSVFRELGDKTAPPEQVANRQ
ncbi:MarR family transcriptional regulator [Thalassospira lucentensis]|uniref:MarR family winged helix-turn-helix transcriptional regulator n=1 Tax=Thalassospira lucentensis TaxID=168935 RepID=UPI0029438AAE|nr:MarR family transcriptional regulator [Thalassospira lucentensis]WOI10258.1 MarR family transcriptional regulator [Thalassospira lucentensis]